MLLYCEENTIPIVFALGRRALGRACGKFVPVSIVGIFDYSGVDEKYHQMIGAVQDARDRYQKLVNTVARDIDTQKERVAVERQAKVDEEIEAEKAVATKSVTSSEETMENESDAADNISRAMSRELIDKIKSERQSFQCHSRNVSAQSAFSVCSLVSQTQSDRDWREMAGDEPETNGTTEQQQQQQQQENSKTDKPDNNNEIE